MICLPMLFVDELSRLMLVLRCESGVCLDNSCRESVLSRGRRDKVREA